VTALSVLILLLPIAALVALLLAWPLARFLPRRPVLGWILVIAGLAGYVWFSAGPIPAVAGALGVAVIGLALLRGHVVRAAP
jgi:FtsH-binding integral membrane protein